MNLPQWLQHMSVWGRIAAFVQHGTALLTEPEVLGVFSADPGGWRYLRMKFRLYPGQGALIEQTFKQRALAALRGIHAEYGDWMITVTYGAD